MPDPVQEPQRQESPARLPAVDRRAQTRQDAERMLRGMEYAALSDRPDLLTQFDAAERARQEREPLRSALSTAVLERLSQPEQAATEAQQWLKLAQLALLARLDPAAATARRPDCEKAASAVLERILARKPESPSELDLQARQLKSLIGLASEVNAGDAIKAGTAALQDCFVAIAGLPNEQFGAHLSEVLKAAIASQGSLQTASAKDFRLLRELHLSNDPSLGADWKELLQAFQPRLSGALEFRDAAGRRWDVEAFGEVRAETSAPSHLILRHRGEPAAVVGFDSAHLRSLIRSDGLDARLTQALADTEAEQERGRQSPLNDTRIDPSRTAVISVLPLSSDLVTTNAVFGTASLARVAVRGEGAEDRRALIVSDEPRDALLTTLARLTESQPGLKHLLIDFSQHGTPQGLLFKGPITAADLRLLSERYPEHDIVVTTLACYGGGLIASLEQGAAVPQNLSIFPQSRIEMRTPLSYLSEQHRGEALQQFQAPLPQLLFIDALRQNPGALGPAFERSDRETKRVIPLDQEALIRGRRHH